MIRRLALRRGWVLPFPRLRYRLRFGRWCDPERFWSVWYLIDMGRAKMRRCLECDHPEIV